MCSKESLCIVQSGENWNLKEKPSVFSVLSVFNLTFLQLHSENNKNNNIKQLATTETIISVCLEFLGQAYFVTVIEKY